MKSNINNIYMVVIIDNCQISVRSLLKSISEKKYLLFTKCLINIILSSMLVLPELSYEIDAENSIKNLVLNFYIF